MTSTGMVQIYNQMGAWIMEHGELDWKQTFTGLNVGFSRSALSGVKLYHLPLWEYTGSKPI